MKRLGEILVDEFGCDSRIIERAVQQQRSAQAEGGSAAPLGRILRDNGIRRGLLAAIVVWNTVHWQACLRRLQTDGRAVADKDLRFLSPLIYRHVGIYGQYRFDVTRLEALPSPENFTY